MMGYVFFRSITDAFIAPSAVYSHDLSSAAIIIKVMGCRISISRGNENVCPFNNRSRQMNKTANKRKRLVNYLNKPVFM